MRSQLPTREVRNVCQLDEAGVNTVDSSWIIGQVEGQINRFKTFKCQM